MIEPKRIGKLDLPEEVAQVLEECPGYTLFTSIEELFEAAVPTDKEEWFDVKFPVEGRGDVTEAQVCRVKNGVAANYLEPYMRRRDPNCMLIGDELPTDKTRYTDRFSEPFGDTRKETLEWLKTQKLACYPFAVGKDVVGVDGLVVAPWNAGFFALGLALLQGIKDINSAADPISPSCILYVAPTFRHTHFDGKQVVVHNRSEELYEIFSYNLYPGPSAKKGIYGALIHYGEMQDWVTAHASAVQVITPYDNKVTIMHEGASGGGKSEMLEHVHREENGSLLVGENLVSGDKHHITLPRTCALRPIADDMALCHPSIQRNDGKLYIADAEDSWFIRVDHITNYGTDPDVESRSIHPSHPLLFLNIDAKPGSTALLWEHIEDAPGKTCPNPRFVFPRESYPHVVKKPVGVDIRSFGVRTPPCTKEKPTYGIIGLTQILPPSLAWLWRLVSPRGHANPSIVDEGAMSSEGVGSYWPFATGKRVNQANLLLKQIMETPQVRYILCPNQHIGAWRVRFMPQWIMREYLSRRGGAWFTENQIEPAPTALLGYSLKRVVVEGVEIHEELLQPQKQLEIGEETYRQGAEILHTFFEKELQQFMNSSLMPEGREIIQCVFDRGTVSDFEKLIESQSFIVEE
ncbi:MAG: DUF4914 family protein [Spirochaetaceae bacterium]